MMPGSDSLDRFIWGCDDVPEQVRLYLAAPPTLRALGMVEFPNDDPTGARGLLRRAVAARLRTHPDEVVLHSAAPSRAWWRRSRGSFARPLAARNQGRKRDVRKRPLWTSLARSADLIVVATAEIPIGVDIEELQQPRHADELVAVFHPSDQVALRAFTGRQRLIEITEAWARKEAVLKAQGIGLNRDPAQDRVGTHSDPLAPRGWRSRSSMLTYPIGADGARLGPVHTNQVGPTHAVGIAWRSLIHHRGPKAGPLEKVGRSDEHRS